MVMSRSRAAETCEAGQTGRRELGNKRQVQYKESKRADSSLLFGRIAGETKGKSTIKCKGNQDKREEKITIRFKRNRGRKAGGGEELQSRVL